MDLAAAKMIGAGLACIALVGAGVGIGLCSATTCKARCAIRPRPRRQTTNMFLGFALCEATGLFGLVIALIILFGM